MNEGRERKKKKRRSLLAFNYEKEEKGREGGERKKKSRECNGYESHVHTAGISCSTNVGILQI